MVTCEKSVRVIARLDVKGPNLIKGLQLEGHRVLGHPAEFARTYFEHDIDEIVLVDNVASLYERPLNLEVVRDVAETIFVPLTVVGGITCLDDIESAFRAGADRVGINTSAVSNPQLIAEAVSVFGSQSIVGSVDCFLRNDREYEVWTKCGHEVTNLNAFDWCKRLEELGVGELIVTSINNDGLGRGFDIGLLGKVCLQTGIPVVASGGAGKIEDFVDASLTGVSGIAAGSVFHYKYVTPNDSVTLNFSESDLRLGKGVDTGNTEFINYGYGRNRALTVQPLTIKSVKDAMYNSGIPVRRSYVR